MRFHPLTVNAPEWFHAANCSICRDGDRLIVVSRTGVRVANLNPDPRPTNQLILLAQALSGSMIDPTGAHVPLDTDTLRTVWEKLHK